MNATTFYLIRHASYSLLGSVLAGRAAGHFLNEQGHAEARALADALAGHDITAVVSSPLERTRETAAAIAGRLGLPVITEDALTEIDFGAWEGMRFDALHGDPAWQAFNRFRSSVAPPGGETMLAAQQRAIDAVLRLHAQWPGQTIAVISHADVIKAMLAHFLAMPLDLFQRIEVAPASRSIVLLFAANVRVDGINLPPGE